MTERWTRTAGWILAAGVGLAAAGRAEEPGAAVERARRASLASDGALRHVEALTTEVGNRFSGTDRDALAVEWAVGRLKSLGFPKVWTEPVTVPHWIRGEAEGEILAPWPHRVELIALGGSVGTPEAGVEAPVVAAETVDALEELPDDAVRGRIVFLYQHMRRTNDGSGYGETVRIRSRGPSAAAKKGALAVVIRSVGTDSNRLPHTGGLRYEEGVERFPAAALSAPDAEQLERELASGREVRFRLRLTSRYEEDAESANVLAEIPGHEAPGEIVVLMAHRDSWDVGTGAQDNGTGVALVMEAARLAGLAGGAAPRRSIRVVLTANEEFGLSGARAYAERHAEEMGAHVVGLEADSGAGRVLEVRTRFAETDEPAAEELAAVVAPLGIPRDRDEAWGGADLSRLRPLGVPLIDLRQDASLYFDLHHSENDTFDKIDPDALRQVQTAFASTVAWIANREARLGEAPPYVEQER